MQTTHSEIFVIESDKSGNVHERIGDFIKNQHGNETGNWIANHEKESASRPNDRAA